MYSCFTVYVQVASYILTRNFESTKDLLKTDFSANTNYKLLRHNPWCDTEDGSLCQNCKACTPLFSKQL